MPKCVHPVLSVHQNWLGSLKSAHSKAAAKTNLIRTSEVWRGVTRASVTLKGIQISSILKVENHGD